MSVNARQMTAIRGWASCDGLMPRLSPCAVRRAEEQGSRPARPDGTHSIPTVPLVKVSNQPHRLLLHLLKLDPPGLWLASLHSMLNLQKAALRESRDLVVAPAKPGYQPDTRRRLSLHRRIR